MSEIESSDQYKINDEQTAKHGFGVRHVQTLLMFLALSMGVVLRVDMSVAIIAMTDNSTSQEIETFAWNKKTQDLILSAFFWGYVLLQIPGGQLAQRYGIKILIVTAMLVNGILTIAIPWAALNGGWKAVCTCRAIQGLTQAPIFPCIHTFLSKWIPSSEQSRLGNFVYTGISVGTIIGMPLSSLLASTSYGWPCIFYVIGLFSIIIGLLFLWYGASTPQSHKSISAEEKYYIETSLKSRSNKMALKTPWISILTSIPVLALTIGQVGIYWGVVTLFTEIPTYFKRALGIDVKRSGLLTALPYTAMWFGSILMSFISDYIVNKNICSKKIARRIFNTIASWGPALGLISLGYVPPGYEILAISILTLSVGLMSGMNLGYMMNHIDLSPNFAGTLMGITNFIANIFGLLAPITVGFILENDTDLEQWRIVFFCTASVFFISNLVFIIFSSSDRQAWNEPDISNKTNGIVLDELKILNEDKIKT